MLPTLPVDKANHLITGAVIAIAAGAIAARSDLAPMARLVGLLAAGAAGVLKEGADYLANRRAAAAGQPAPHGVEGMDAVATAAGGLLVWVGAALTEVTS